MWQEAGPQPSDHPPTTRLDTNLQKFDFEGLHTSLRDGGFLHVGSSANIRWTRSIWGWSGGGWVVAGGWWQERGLQRERCSIVMGWSAVLC